MIISNLLPTLAQAWGTRAGSSTTQAGLSLGDLRALAGRPSVLFAQRARWERLGDRFQKNREVDWENFLLWLGLALCFALVAFVLIKIIHRKEKQIQTDSGQHLFLELCRAHDLTWKTQRLLKRLAKELELAEPALLFLDPDLFTSDRLPAALAKHAEPLAKLRERLFATG